MKFSIVSRGDNRSRQLKDKMKHHLVKSNLIYDEKHPELVISVGGDGTFLDAFHRYVHRLNHTAFIGIHTGYLGFYADCITYEVEKLMNEIDKTTFQIIIYPYLFVII